MHPGETARGSQPYPARIPRRGLQGDPKARTSGGFQREIFRDPADTAQGPWRDPAARPKGPRKDYAGLQLIAAGTQIR